MRYLGGMQTVRVEIPAELVLAAGLDAGNLAVEATRLLALELYREDKVSLGRAAELCHTPVEQFMEFAGRHNVAASLWRQRTGGGSPNVGTARAVIVVSNSSPLISFARIGRLNLLASFYERVLVPTRSAP